MLSFSCSQLKGKLKRSEGKTTLYLVASVDAQRNLSAAHVRERLLLETLRDADEGKKEELSTNERLKAQFTMMRVRRAGERTRTQARISELERQAVARISELERQAVARVSELELQAVVNAPLPPHPEPV
ncbi:hypothetical protein T492DRAFT_856820 [Pavlovales sp. CCMP2436]|nr:hypothetical protein T492DRAFT_856820 [Pavlovales sp. CCMP2436]